MASLKSIQLFSFEMLYRKVRMEKPDYRKKFLLREFGVTHEGKHKLPGKLLYEEVWDSVIDRGPPEKDD